MIINSFKEHLIDSDDTIRKVIIKLQKIRKKFCIVVDKNNKYIGTLTDGDIRRGLLLNLTLKNKVIEICNKKSHFIKSELKESKVQEIMKKKKN